MECFLTEFEYFQPQVLQNQVIGTSFLDLSPISTLQHQSPIEFHYSGAPNIYLDLNSSYLYIRAKIVGADGGNVAAGSDVSPINNAIDSLFSHIHVELNGKTVTQNNQLYHYRAMFEKLLSYNTEVQNTQLKSGLFIKDTAGKLGDYSRADGGTNLGLKARGAYFDTSAEVDLIGRPCVDIFNQPRALIHNIPLTMRLVPNTDKFILMTPAGTVANPQVNYQIHITEARMFLKCLHVSPSLVLAHERMLQGSNAKYDLTRVTMKHISIPSGQTHAPFDTIYMGELPKRIVLAMVSDAAMAGGYQQNPFNFQHFNLNYLALNVNGETIPSRPYQPDFQANRYIREYNSVFEGMGNQFTNSTVAITREEFKAGYTIFVFDLSTDQGAGRCVSPVRTGSIRLDMKFSAQTQATISVLLYAEFDSVIQVDKYKNIIAPDY